MSGLTLTEVAAAAGVQPSTVRRWVRSGLVPAYQGTWTTAAAAHVRMVARMRERGHSLAQIRRASESGQLAPAFIEDLLPTGLRRMTYKQAAQESGMSQEVLRQIVAALGIATEGDEALSESDVEMLKYYAALLDGGLPLPALLQLARVYGQAFAQIADAEVRLVHIYVHEPLMREGVPAVQIAEQMEGMASATLPFAAPIMDYLHSRFLRHFIEQDLIGHMEGDAGALARAPGSMRVALAFADLAGYTRLTEQRGEEAALGAVEGFAATVQRTLPAGSRVVKNLGDEVMVVAPDVVALTEWAVRLHAEVPADVPAPRIGVHCGEALYRDGDYYGRDVNQAARVVARAAGGEVLVTAAVVQEAGAAGALRFQPIGEVGLKGFSEPTELYLAFQAQG